MTGISIGLFWVFLHLERPGYWRGEKKKPNYPISQFLRLCLIPKTPGSELSTGHLNQACVCYTHLEFTRRPDRGTFRGPSVQGGIRLDRPSRSQDQPSAKLPSVMSLMSGPEGVLGVWFMPFTLWLGNPWPGKGKDPEQRSGIYAAEGGALMIFCSSVFVPCPAENLCPHGGFCLPCCQLTSPPVLVKTYFSLILFLITVKHDSRRQFGWQRLFLKWAVSTPKSWVNGQMGLKAGSAYRIKNKEGGREE